MLCNGTLIYEWRLFGFILCPNSETKGKIHRNFTGLSCFSIFLGVAPLYELPLYFLVMVDYKKNSLLTRPQLICPTCQTSIRTHENICTRYPTRQVNSLHLDFCLTLTLIRSVTSVFTQGCFCFVLLIRTNIHMYEM